MGLFVQKEKVSDIDAPLVAALLLTLEEMVKGYQRLLAVLQREKELIIEGNVNELRLYLIEKEGLLGELKGLEETRCRQVASFYQMEPSAPLPTFRQLRDTVPFSYREQFASCYDRLQALSASVSDLNQINGLLSMRILRQVNTLLGLLTHLSSAPTYHASGTLHPEFQNGHTAARPAGLFYFQG